jgi:phage virion morphogenesis protein
MAQLIELVDRGALDYLRGFVNRGQNLHPLLDGIGHDLAESATQRFASTTAPDGQAWAPNSQVTLDRYSARFKDEKAERRAHKRPGTDEGTLSKTINWQVRGADTVGIGSPMVYANTFHYGARKGEFGKGAPWGDIPARPFLGLSRADETNIAELIRAHMLAG